MSALGDSVGLVEKVKEQINADAELDSYLEITKRIAIGILFVWGVMAVAIIVGLFFFIVVIPFLTTMIEIITPVDQIISYILFIITLYFIPRLADFAGRNLALLSNAPLRQSLEQIDIEAIRQSSVPVVCTLAEKLPQPISQLGNPSIKFRPYYVLLSQLEHKNDVADVLLQSAAIPEVFRSKQIGKRRFLDGGLADNTPILGVFEERPSTVLVIYLDNRFGRVANLAQWELTRLRRVLASMGRTKNDELINWFMAIRVIPIIPSSTLGNLLLGTMNFSTTKSRRLLWLGYKDALIQLTKAAHA